ncbi:hypothetical protein [Taibaiella sp. KBW10]|uniref:hypothetical protein n=1 Tax=Taibaiella sp. KBW10 TaxID=2153357 RepID=UPI000F593B30|nr:hypothetical protein [Taibaiella sp. KBW10]
MEMILQYLVQVNVYALIMTLVYWICLRNQNAFRWSRVYLCTTAILPYVLPLVSWPEFIRHSTVYRENMAFVLSETMITGSKATASGTGTSIIAVVYGLTVSVLMIRFIAYLLRFYKLVRIAGYQQEGTYRMIYRQGIAPGSFLRYILLPESAVHPDIIRHEKAHVDLKHSYDILGIGLLQCFGFFNLILPLVRKELLLIHEFHADQRAASDTASYAHLLAQQGFNTLSVPTYHSFFTHPIKRRIMMLYNTSRTSRIRKAGAVILFSGLFLAGITIQSKARATETAIVAETKDPVFRSVEEAPRAGYEWQDYIVKNLKLPEIAKGRQYDCKFYIQYIVEKDGSISNVKYQQFANKNEQIPLDEVLVTALKESAIKVVSDMPAWTPGKQNGKAVRTYFTVPISFKSE